MSLRDKIMKSEDIPSETLVVPEWDVELLVKGMSAGDRLTLMQAAFDANTGQVNMSIVYPDVLVACTFDPETGEEVFTPEDKAAILSKSSAAVERVASVGLRLSGIGKDESDEAGESFSGTQSGDSSLN